VAKAHKKRTRKPPKLLLFVDTNIWLDVYRGRSEASLTLVGHLESDGVKDHLIGTYQLEMGYKKNRRAAILDGMKALNIAPAPRLGIFSNKAAFSTAERALQKAADRVKTLKTQLSRILETPTKHDPVYQAFQRLFPHRESPLVLRGEGATWRRMYNRALRRFLMGCPPRKANETSMGDAINWEWMLECAKNQHAGLVIVSRDGDYGMDFEQRAYLNEHLLHEFKERVSKQGTVILYRKLSDALKHFNVTVTEAEEKEEKEVVDAPGPRSQDEVAVALRIQQAFDSNSIVQNARAELERQFREMLENINRTSNTRVASRAGEPTAGTAPTAASSETASPTAPPDVEKV